MKKLFLQHITPELALQFSQLSRQGSMILTGILLVKIQLSLEIIGLYELLMYLVSVSTFFWVNGLIQGFLSVYPKLSADRQKAFINEAYSVFFTISIIVLILFLLFYRFLIPILTGRDSMPYLTVTGLYFLFQISTFLLDYLLFLKKKRGLQLLNGILHLAALVAVVLPLWWFENLYFSLVSLTILAIIRHIWLIAVAGLPFQFFGQENQLRKWLTISYPLVGYALVAGFAPYFDLWLISNKYPGNAATFVFFKYGAREIPVSLIIATTFSSAMIPLLAKEIHQLDAFKLKTERLMHLLFPLTFFLLLASGYIFQFLYNSDFSASVPIFNIFLLLIISRLLFPNTLLIAMEKTGTLLKIAVLEMLLKIGLSLLFVELWGMTGLAWSTVISALFEKIMYILILQKRYHIDFQQYTPVKWWALYSILLLGLYFLY